MEPLGTFQQSASKLPITSLPASCINFFISLPIAWSGWADLSRNPVTWIDVLSVSGGIQNSWGTKGGLLKQSQNKGDNCFWKHLSYIIISLFNQLHVIFEVSCPVFRNLSFAGPRCLQWREHDIRDPFNVWFHLDVAMCKFNANVVLCILRSYHTFQ